LKEVVVSRLALPLVGLGMVLVLVGSVLSSEKQEPNLRFIMQRKLDQAHSILEALITEDFETLEDSAGALRALSEEAGWFVITTPEYAERSSAFRRAVFEIEQSAKEKNLDRAALGYVDMTLQCVRCHQFLRGTARAGLPPR
jgi:NAD(P)H-dependent FMN reductase